MSKVPDGYSVRIWLKASNYRIRPLIRQFQALADCTGREGIIGKKGEKIDKVLARGFMRVRFKTLAAAQKFADLLSEFWSSAATWKVSTFYRPA